MALGTHDVEQPCCVAELAHQRMQFLARHYVAFQRSREVILDVFDHRFFDFRSDAINFGSDRLTYPSYLCTELPLCICELEPKSFPNQHH